MSLLIAVKSTSEAAEFRRPQQRPIPGRPIKHGLITSADASCNGLSIGDPHLTPGHANNDTSLSSHFSPRIYTTYAGRWRGGIEHSIPTPLFPSSASKFQVKQRPQRRTSDRILLSRCPLQSRVSRRSAPGTHGSSSDTGIACDDRELALPAWSINKSLLMPDPQLLDMRRENLIQCSRFCGAKH